MSKTKVIHLRIEGKSYFFGSVKAMFDYMGEGKLGMSYRSFHSNVHLEEDETYRNRRRGYEVTLSHLIQAKSERGLQGSAQAAHILKMQREAGVMPDLSAYMKAETEAAAGEQQDVLGEQPAEQPAKGKGPVQLDLFS